MKNLKLVSGSLPVPIEEAVKTYGPVAAEETPGKTVTAVATCVVDGNWGDELPRVYRWAYDYSVPGAPRDFIPQNEPHDDSARYHRT